MDVTFSINEYDFEGDISEKGIYLHFGQVRIKVAETMEEYEDLLINLYNIKTEILENNYRLT